ncbi:metal ABC transporter solute-binding protein, Zn/Mn family [Dongia sedimenti]|uniref:Zinc ABC transporter substrate-binding protein n=1 Tax=Dongia sedimenti TaxID=3064282 RepID=A0ABU0YGQ8_9PROT|nr:zinc ABC transporter substrate-binding protein [Rhodospirillaceae bacterium R-7]
MAKRVLSRAMVSAAFLLALAGPAVAAEKPKVVATFTIIGDLVEAVGGDAVSVTTLVGPDGDAHVFEPRPSDVAAVAQADLIVANGLGMEPWLGRLTEAADFKGKTVIASAAVTPLPFKEEADGSGTMPDDPHAFQDLSNGRLYVKTIAAALEAVAPNQADAIAARAAKLDGEMAALDQEIKAKLGALPAANRRILTSHDAFHYFGKAYGLDILSIQGISTETEPSAADLGAIARQARNGQVKAIFLENMSNPTLAQTISSESGLPVGGELVADALTKEGGLAPHYLDMFKYNLAELLKVLK